MFHVIGLRHANPVTTALIERRASEASRRGVTLQRKQVWAPYERISPNLVLAVIAGEDIGFFRHHGIDFEAVRRAISIDVSERRLLRGASTIEQQLAKNLFLSPSRNPLRKAHEAVIALEMDQILGKRRVLELYLNVIEWADAVYGAEAAAAHYFNTSAALLSYEQAAFLSAVIPGPRDQLNPARYPDRVRERMRRIKELMNLMLTQEFQSLPLSASAVVSH